MGDGANQRGRGMLAQAQARHALDGESAVRADLAGRRARVSGGSLQ